MDRRTFLRTVTVLTGALGTGSLVAACGEGGGGIPGGQPAFNVISASLETLAGPSQRVAFAVTTVEQNVPVKDGDIEVYLRDLEGDVRSGPYEAEFFDERGVGLGVYRAFLDVSEPGTYEMVAVSGDDHGAALINVVRPEDSRLVVPGQPAISTPTPTNENPMGAAELCTSQPACGMHEISLDRALAEGRPLALMFATPAYCQTAICGPAVTTLEEVRGAGDWGETAFIHCEIFSDAGVTLLPPVEAWNLPTEPWLFLVDSDGIIAERLDGPMIGAEIQELLGGLA
jgi:hypothetical protein